MKLFHHSRSRRQERASTLVLAVTICGLGTLGVVATASIIQARGMEAEQTQTYTERWTRLQNSKALARQVLLSKYTASGRGPTALEAYTLPDGWGEISVEAFATAPMSATSQRINKTGAVPFTAFSQDVAIGVSDGDYLYEYQFQIKSANPMLGGSLLVMHQPLVGGANPDIIGNVRVKGQLMMSSVNSAINDNTILADEFLGLGDGASNPAVKTSDGTDSLPVNFPFATRTSSIIGGTAAYDGRVSIIENDETPHNAYLSKIQTTGLTVEFDGDIPYALGVGVDTVAAGPDDGLLIAAITGGGGWGTIQDALIAASPLSSDVLRAYFAVDPPAGNLKNVLDANAPLANDIIPLVVASTTLSDRQKKEILADSPIIGSSDGAGNVIILPISDIGAHLLVRNARAVVFEGPTDAADLTAMESHSPIVVVIQQKDADSNQLDTVEFNEENRRELVVAIQRESVGDVSIPVSSATAFPQWRMLLEMESTRADFDIGSVSGFTIEGGIRTDQTLEVSSGTLTLDQDANPSTTYQSLASRDAWIEEFLN